jgi:hypothetical protein
LSAEQSVGTVAPAALLFEEDFDDDLAEVDGLDEAVSDADTFGFESLEQA